LEVASKVKEATAATDAVPGEKNSSTETNGSSGSVAADGVGAASPADGVLPTNPESSGPGLPSLPQPQQQSHHRLSRWNEKIAMKEIFRQADGVSPELLVPTLYSCYFDSLTGNGNTAGGAEQPTADEEQIRAAVYKAVANAFENDGSLKLVHVKPSHMCRGLGITQISREDFQKAKEATSEGKDPTFHLNKDMFRERLSRELAPLALRHARRGVLIEPHVTHTSEIRVTCVFGQPVAAVSYRPNDSTGEHDIMFDAAKSRESATRRVMAYLAKVDKATGATSSLWKRIATTASAVARGTDFLRVDFFLNAESGQFWLNEMDTTYAYMTATGFHGYLACDFIGQLWFYVWRQKLRSRQRQVKRAQVLAAVAAARKAQEERKTQSTKAAAE